MAISVVEPAGSALDWTKHVLFRTGSFEKWIGLGFCAWLATLGEGGFRFILNMCSSGDLPPELGDLVKENVDQVIVAAVILVALAVGICLLVAWLSSRGRFMFLDGVVKNRADVVEPWYEYAELGNSLFLFRMVFWVGTVCAIVAAVGLGALMIIPALSAGGASEPLAIAAISLTAIMALSLAALLVLIKVFLADFVVPIMYLFRLKTMAAWRVFWQMLLNNLGSFLLYVIFKSMIGMVVGILAVVLLCATCCLAVIPYVSTVIMLPLIVFMQTYSIHFLAQFGPRFAPLAAGMGRVYGDPALEDVPPQF